MKLNQYAKAIISALATGLGSLQVAIVDHVVTGEEWVIVVAAMVGALGFTWGVPNTPIPVAPLATWATRPGQHRPENTVGTTVLGLPPERDITGETPKINDDDVT